MGFRSWWGVNGGYLFVVGERSGRSFAMIYQNDADPRSNVIERVPVTIIIKCLLEAILGRRSWQENR